MEIEAQSLKFNPADVQQVWERLTAAMNDILIQSQNLESEGPEVQLHYQKVLEAKLHKLHQAYVKFHWEFLGVIDEKGRELCPWKNVPSQR